MAQLVKHLILGFSWGNDLIRLSTTGVEPAWDSLSAPSPCVHAHALSLSLFLKINLKNKAYAQQKQSLTKWKGNPTEWVKKFANDISNKGLVTKTYKENSTPKNPQIICLKMGRGPEHMFAKENTLMANRHMKRCSISLITREMQIKTQWYHPMPVRTASITKTRITSVSENVEKREPLCTVGGNVNWCSHYGKE